MSLENRYNYGYNTPRSNDSRRTSKIESVKRNTRDSLYKNFNRHK